MDVIRKAKDSRSRTSTGNIISD